MVLVLPLVIIWCDEGVASIPEIDMDVESSTALLNGENAGEANPAEALLLRPEAP